MSEVMISMKGIAKSYGKHRVLEDIDLEINKGDIFGIVGKNGAGKTTASYSLLPEMLNCTQFVNSDEFAKGLSPFTDKL